MTDAERPASPEEWPPEALIDAGRQLRAMGRAAEALAAFDIACRKAPNEVAAWSGAALANYDLARYHLSAAAFERAVKLAPNDANLWRNLGHVRLLAAWPVPAAQALERAVALDPANLGAWDDLGTALTGVWGRAKDAIAAYDRAIALDPARADLASRRLIALAFDADLPTADLFAAHRQFGAKVEALAGPVDATFANDRDPERKLRVGYLSSNLYAHIASAEIRTALRRHDRASFAVHVYATMPERDAITDELRGYADFWTDAGALDDSALAAKIRDDGIDILVHTMGHWQQNRLAVFARRAAPVQVEYLCQSPSAGIAACDAFIADRWISGDGALASLSGDRIVDLPGGYYTTSFLPDAPIQPPPRARGGAPVVFGSFNRVAKISTATLHRWARVLAELPQARLMVKIPERFDRAEEARMRDAWAACGLDVSRVEIRGHADGGAYWDQFADVDALLDCVPFNGGRTTGSAAWMGVPTISEAGPPVFGRLTLCIMTRLGLGDLVGADEDGYVAAAVKLGRDPARLDDIRRTLRDRFRASTLFESEAHIREVEAAYRRLWRDYCAR
jgi:predicted O-linked N-acetylglucosamine transferase (SPINDLY family)